MAKYDHAQHGSSTDDDRGMAGVAIQGTAWATGQLLLNKIATVVAVLAIAKYLTTSEFGLAALALSISKFLSILPPLNMGDVLIARGAVTVDAFAAARRTVLAIGVAIAVLGIAASIPAAWFFHDYPKELLIPLVCVACLRPIGEAMQVSALTQLRMQFRNKAIAVTDGSVQLAGTALSVLLAWYGAGAWALVGVSTVVAFGKAASYQLMVRRSSGVSPFNSNPSEVRVRHEFLAAAGGQYLHSVVDSLPFLMLGWLSTASDTGLYAFAVSLSSQANVLVSTQVSSVLQPVLGRLGHDSNRQSKAYVRAISTLSAIAVPVCLTQAIFSGVIFAIFFDERWSAAAPVFAALSILESFFFAAAPTMAMLKAQGKFRTFVLWQGCHLFLSAGILFMAAMWWGALGVAVVGAVLWSISLPLVVWLSIRNAGFGPVASIRIFAAPWMTAIPIGLIAWSAIDPLSELGQGGRLAALFLMAPVTLIAMLLATRWSQPTVYHEVAGLISRIARRLPLVKHFVTTENAR
jgi:O-antigen/teichoic acid export membrane protein